MTSSSKHICEFCGSANVCEIDSCIDYPIPYASTLKHHKKVFHCNDCDGEEEISVDMSTAEFLSDKNPAYTQAITESVKNILENLQENNISQARIERAFDIPKRTLSKWSNGVNQPSAASIAFLRQLRMYPWLIKTAENNFDEVKCHQIALVEELQKFHAELKKSFSLSHTITTSSNKITFKVDISPSNPKIQVIGNTTTEQGITLSDDKEVVCVF